VQFKLGRVTQIVNSNDLQTVRLDDGSQLTSRLLVLACGLNGDLLPDLNLKRNWIQKSQSLALAFTLERPDGAPFAFDAITYSLASAEVGIDYLSLFPVNGTLRANLFGFPAEDSSWVQRLVRYPNREIPRLFPRLSRAIGTYRAIGKVETAWINLYRTEGEAPPGLVLLGDACQNVCPSTGIGVLKVLTDVEVLRDCMPGWFQGEGMDKQKLRSYFEDPRKKAVDRKALQTALYRRNATLEQSTKWRIHRARLSFERQIQRLNWSLGRRALEQQKVSAP
jgi:2-polyprenyl-6-methoxyphenol hydroxylase-like FAD-dependent oxidoreductase